MDYGLERGAWHVFDVVSGATHFRVPFRWLARLICWLSVG